MQGGLRLFIGTYTRDGSRGIYAARLDTASGALGMPSLAAEAADPTFLVAGPAGDRIFAVTGGPGQARSFRVDSGTDILRPLQPQSPSQGAPNCHLALDTRGRMMVASHYHEGTLSWMAVGADGSLGTPTTLAHHGSSVHPVRQTVPHVHGAAFSPDDRFVFVCDLGLDRIFRYRADASAAVLTEATPPFESTAPGSGPRHFAFAPGGRHGYAIHEIANTLVAYAYRAETGALDALQTVSTLPPGFAAENTAAEIAIHPNGRFLYASNRGHDSVAVFGIGGDGRLSAIEWVPCGGRSPRHIALSPDAAWLVSSNQDSNSLTSFRVDSSTGRLTRVPGSIGVSTPVCVAFA